MRTGKALVIVGLVVVAVGGGVGLAYVLKGNGKGGAPALPSPGGAAAAAPKSSRPASSNPFDQIGGAINALGGVANSVDHLFGGAIGDFFGQLTRGGGGVRAHPAGRG